MSFALMAARLFKAGLSHFRCNHTVPHEGYSQKFSWSSLGKLPLLRSEPGKRRLAKRANNAIILMLLPPLLNLILLLTSLK